MPAKTARAFASRPLSAVAAKVTGSVAGGAFSTRRTWIASTRRALPVVPAVRPSCLHSCQPIVATWARYSTRYGAPAGAMIAKASSRRPFPVVPATVPVVTHGCQPMLCTCAR